MLQFDMVSTRLPPYPAPYRPISPYSALSIIACGFLARFGSQGTNKLQQFDIIPMEPELVSDPSLTDCTSGAGADRAVAERVSDLQGRVQQSDAKLPPHRPASAGDGTSWGRRGPGPPEAASTGPSVGRAQGAAQRRRPRTAPAPLLSAFATCPLDPSALAFPDIPRPSLLPRTSLIPCPSCSPFALAPPFAL